MVKVRAYTSKHSVKNMKSSGGGGPGPLGVLAGCEAAEDGVEGREAVVGLGLQGSTWPVWQGTETVPSLG